MFWSTGEGNGRGKPKLNHNKVDRIEEANTEREKTSLVHFYPHAKNQQEGNSDQR